jgi:hypothetical protein
MDDIGQGAVLRWRAVGFERIFRFVVIGGHRSRVPCKPIGMLVRELLRGRAVSSNVHAEDKDLFPAVNVTD